MPQPPNEPGNQPEPNECSPAHPAKLDGTASRVPTEDEKEQIYLIFGVQDHSMEDLYEEEEDIVRHWQQEGPIDLQDYETAPLTRPDSRYHPTMCFPKGCLGQEDAPNGMRLPDGMWYFPTDRGYSVRELAMGYLRASYAGLVDFLINDYTDGHLASLVEEAHADPPRAASHIYMILTKIFYQLIRGSEMFVYFQQVQALHLALLRGKRYPYTCTIPQYERMIKYVLIFLMAKWQEKGCPIHRDGAKVGHMYDMFGIYPLLDWDIYTTPAGE